MSKEKRGIRHQGGKKRRTFLYRLTEITSPLRGEKNRGVNSLQKREVEEGGGRSAPIWFGRDEPPTRSLAGRKRKKEGGGGGAPPSPYCKREKKKKHVILRGRRRRGW